VLADGLELETNRHRLQPNIIDPRLSCDGQRCKHQEEDEEDEEEEEGEEEEEEEEEEEAEEEKEREQEDQEEEQEVDQEEDQEEDQKEEEEDEEQEEEEEAAAAAKEQVNIWQFGGLLITTCGLCRSRLKSLEFALFLGAGHRKWNIYNSRPVGPQTTPK
jgi:thiol:disulfide interchange protein